MGRAVWKAWLWKAGGGDFSLDQGLQVGKQIAKAMRLGRTSDQGSLPAIVCFHWDLKGRKMGPDNASLRYHRECS